MAAPIVRAVTSRRARVLLTHAARRRRASARRRRPGRHAGRGQLHRLPADLRHHARDDGQRRMGLRSNIRIRHLRSVLAIGEGARPARHGVPARRSPRCSPPRMRRGRARCRSSISSPAGSLSPGKAAKLIVLVAEPLGLDPTSFDPAGNGSPVNLVTLMGSGNADGSFGPPGAFNQTLFAALAKKLVDGSVPSATTNYIGTKQKPSNGGWAFDADTGTNTDADVDTTSLAIQALIAGGVAATDPSVQNGLAFTVSQQNGDGSWSAFGNVSSESTSRAILAIASAGYDPNSSCWRDTVRPDLAGSPYGSAGRRTRCASGPERQHRRGRDRSAPRSPPRRRSRGSSASGCRSTPPPCRHAPARPAAPATDRRREVHRRECRRQCPRECPRARPRLPFSERRRSPGRTQRCVSDTSWPRSRSPRWRARPRHPSSRRHPVDPRGRTARPSSSSGTARTSSRSAVGSAASTRSAPSPASRR